MSDSDKVETMVESETTPVVDNSEVVEEVDSIDNNNDGNSNTNNNDIADDVDDIDDDDGGLFGDDDDDDDDDDDMGVDVDNDNNNNIDNNIDNNDIEEDDDDNDSEEQQEEEQITTTKVSISRHPVSSKSNKALIFNVPRFLSVDAVPFNPNSIDDDEENENNGSDDESVTKTKRFKALKLANTIRWRYAKTIDGKVYKQSNASIIEWDNGSLSLKLGNEILDLYDKKCESIIGIKDDEQDIIITNGINVTKAVDIRPVSTKSMAHRSLATVLSNRTKRTVKPIRANPTLVQSIEPIRDIDDSTNTNTLSQLKRAGADLYK